MVWLLRAAALFAWHLPLCASATLQYYATLLYFLLRPAAPIDASPLLQGDTAALVWVYSLAKAVHLWNEPHYRAPSFAHDLRCVCAVCAGGVVVLRAHVRGARPAGSRAAGAGRCQR